MSKEATEAARKKAAEAGVEVESIEGSGDKVTAKDVQEAVKSGEAKFLAFANPELGSNSVVVFPTDNPEIRREFFRSPMAHPEGPEAQMVTQEEFDKFNFNMGSVMALAKKGS